MKAEHAYLFAVVLGLGGDPDRDVIASWKRRLKKARTIDYRPFPHNLKSAARTYAAIVK